VAERSQVSVKTLVAVGLASVIAVALVMAVVNSTLAITLSSAALLLALALDRAVQALVRRGVRRGIAIVIVTICLVGFVGGLLDAVVPPAIRQGRALVRQIPDYVRNVRQSPTFRKLDQRFNISERVEGTTAEMDTGAILSGATGPVLSALGSLLSFAAAAVTVFFLAMFMLIFGGPLVHAAIARLASDHRDTYESVLDKIYRSIGGYVTGLAAICGINASLTATFLAINHVPFFLPLAILSGLSSTIPYAGPVTAAAFISLLTLVTEGPWRCLASVIYFVIYGQIEGNILGPLIFRRTVEVNPLLVTLSILFLGEIFGITGAVVAVPVVAALQIVVRELLAIRDERRRALVTGTGQPPT
jgi:putative heme transporter